MARSIIRRMFVLNKYINFNCLSLKPSFVCRRYSSRVNSVTNFREKYRQTLESFQPNTIETQMSEPIGQPDSGNAGERKEIVEFKEKETVLVPPYVKLEQIDERFLKIVTTLKSRKHREKSGKILLEGVRLINDAIDAGVELQTLFFSREETLSRINLKDWERVEIYKVLYRTLKVWSDVSTCPGIMGVFKNPSKSHTLVMNDPVIPVTVICENIRDPGNMGSIIRNAAAAGCKAVLLTKGCVDPWEFKALRTGMGAHFRIPIIKNIGWENMLSYIPENASIYLADNSSDLDLLQSDIVAEVDYIEGEQEYNDEERYVCQSEEGERMLVDNSYIKEEHLDKYEEVALTCHLYSSTKFPKTDIIVYVGGETYGISPQAKKLACEFGGQSVKIPLENGVDSLNSSVALSIILYEIKRQHTEAYITKH